MDIDPLYSTWKRLKEKNPLAHRAPLADISNQDQSKDQNKTPLQEVLQIPQKTAGKKTKTIQGTATLPKHLSGSEVIAFLEERQTKREMEEKQKEERKQKREERKKEREEEQKEKEKRREQRAEEKAKQKEIKERKKEEQKKQREETRRKKQESQKQRQKSTRKERKRWSDTCICPECEEPYDDECEDITWIECSDCKQWFHLSCTELGTAATDLETTDFICHHCLLP